RGASAGLGRRQPRAAGGAGRGAAHAGAGGIAVADQFPAGGVRRAGRAHRSGAGRTRRDPAPDGRLRPGRVPAHHRGHGRRKRAPAGGAGRGAGMSATAVVADWIATRGTPLRGELAVPGDKSVSHRAIMLGAIAEGVTRVGGFLEGEDTRATAAIFARLGVRIEAPSAGERIVHGVGLHGLRPADGPLDCGNAGTGMRLLAGLLAGQAFDSVLVGDASLSKRPMRRVTAPLARMGARIDTGEGGVPPLRIHGGLRLAGVDTTLEVASAQVKSALLLAGLY